MKKHLTLTSRAAVVAITAVSLSLVAAATAADQASPSPAMESSSSMNGKANLSQNDKKFLRKAYKGGRMEVEHAKTAKEKAQNDATKDVADRLITDHTAANEKLESIAKEENLNLPTASPKPLRISGKNFDKQYLMMEKKDHEKDIAMFQEEANDTGTKEDSDVKKFAKDTLPTLKEHLQMVEDALKKVENK